MKRKLELITAIFTAAALLTKTVPGQQPGSISGSVADEQGASVPGALVLYSKIRSLGKDSLGRPAAVGPGLDWGTRTGTDGRFSASSLPEGNYYLCAIGTQANQLKSCEWGGQSSPVHVGAGQSVSGIRLILRTGTLINILVRDPNAQVAAGRRFGVGVISNTGVYTRAKLLNKTGVVSHYAVAVPKGASIKLFLDGPLPGETPLSVRDEATNLVQTRRPSLPIAAGQQAEVTVAVNIE